MTASRAFMLAETIAASALLFVSAGAALSMLVSSAALCRVSEERLTAEEEMNSAVVSLAVRGSPAPYAARSSGLSVCGAAVSRYKLVCDEKYTLLWPDG